MKINDLKKKSVQDVDFISNKQSELDIDLPFGQQNLFRLLIENLPDQIYLKDAQSRFILCNTPVAINGGFASPEEIIGKTDFDCHPKEAAQFFADEQQIMRLDQSLVNHEEQFIDAETNEIKWNLTTKIPVKDHNGVVVGLLGINRDITQMKNALREREEFMKEMSLRNQELEESAKMLYEQSIALNQQTEDLKRLNEQLTQQKEAELEKAIAQGKFEIASEVLHDIGNALVGFGAHLNRINRVMNKNIAGTFKNLSLFIKDQEAVIAPSIGIEKANALVTITDSLTKTQTEAHDEISTAVHELLNIVTHIQEILNIQRQFVKGREGTIERKPVDLADIIDDCRAMLLASMEKKGIRLKINLHPGNNIVKGDKTKLMQVLLNVLKNSIEAIDFNASEKCITVELGTTETATELKVIDNGAGFDQHTASNLFKRGFTTKKSGTGLGLYNCKVIIESHAGSFGIKSDGIGMGAVTKMKFNIN